MSHCDSETSVPDWVIEHPVSLSVFQTLGIDYSCGGKSLTYACQDRGLNVENVLQALDEAIRIREQQTEKRRDDGASSSG